jgi:hypothetical protein
MCNAPSGGVVTGGFITALRRRHRAVYVKRGLLLLWDYSRRAFVAVSRDEAIQNRFGCEGCRLLGQASVREFVAQLLEPHRCR